MKGQSLFSVAFSFLFFSVFATAFQWTDLLGPHLRAGLMARQNNGNTSPQSTATVTPSSTGSSSGSQTNTNTNNGATATSASTGTRTSSQSGTGTITGTGTSRVTGTASGNSTRTTSAIDDREPAGGVSMLIPAPAAGTTFVKVGDTVTFAWNYTSLLVTPDFIDVMATNAVNKQTYTIAANQSFEATQTITWDTGDETATASLPFVVATYTLMVYDAASDPTQVPSPGHLGAYQGLQFGMYTPQDYVGLSEFKCPSCSGAMSHAERQALKVLFGTCALTVLSFTWFASNSGLF